MSIADVSVTIDEGWVAPVAASATRRIVRLRDHARAHPAPGFRSEEGHLLWLRGWAKSAGEKSIIVRRAMAQAHMLANQTPVIDPDELIVGKPCYRELPAEERAELEELRRTVEPTVPETPGQGSHMAIDYERLLSTGVVGVREDVTARLLVGHAERNDFYRSCVIVLDGLLAYARRYADAARTQAATEPDRDRADELLTLSSVLDRVPARPAERFHEAIQSVHFVTVCLEGLYQLGRPDRYLIHLYETDVARGTIDRGRAQELIDCLCILFNEYIPGGLAVGLMVGGSDAAGRTVSNELTGMFIESIDHTRMIYPGIGLCCTTDLSPRLLTRSCELLRDGCTHPALFNDNVIVEGLRAYGLPPEEACEYIHSTCVEITPIATSAVWVASPYINLLEPLLEALGVGSESEAPGTRRDDGVAVAGEGPATEERVTEASHGDHRVPATFEELIADYRSLLDDRVVSAVAEQNRLQALRRETGGNPLVSCFVGDCLETGSDVDWGGARHNWIMPSFVGMANLVDSLVALRELVFDSGRLELREVVDALACDFVGHEGIRRLLSEGSPKYGNDDESADAVAVRVTSWIAEAVAGHRTFRGDRFIPSLFCWVMHERLGSATGATPDGRVSGFPLGDGSGPAQGRERSGPTASILSSTKWDHHPFIGGIAVNLKLSRSAFPAGSTAPLETLAGTYLDRGGFELQVNVVDRSTLIAARERPEKYADLVVRVGGYSDYFTRLSPAMQDEVIERTEHGGG